MGVKLWWVEVILSNCSNSTYSRSEFTIILKYLSNQDKSNLFQIRKRLNRVSYMQCWAQLTSRFVRSDWWPRTWWPDCATFDRHVQEQVRCRRRPVESPPACRRCTRRSSFEPDLRRPSRRIGPGLLLEVIPLDLTSD